MADPQYPDTLLSASPPRKDPPLGGAPQNKFGGKARQFIDSVLQFLEQAFLDYNRAPYYAPPYTITGSCAVGDYMIFDSAAFAANGGYVVRTLKGNFVDETTTPILGPAIQAAGNGGQARVALLGIVPVSTIGLAAAAQGEYTVDHTTGKLRAKAGGELTYAIVDAQGNAMLLPFGRTG